MRFSLSPKKQQELVGFERVKKRKKMHAVQAQLLYLEVFLLCCSSSTLRVDAICDHLAGGVCELSANNTLN